MTSRVIILFLILLQSPALAQSPTTAPVLKPLSIVTAASRGTLSPDGRYLYGLRSVQVVNIWRALVYDWPAAACVGSAVCVLIIGRWIFRRARYRRTVGQPYCGKCNYQLTGITSDRCPECGCDLTGRNRVIAAPVRRRVRIAILAVLAAFCITTPYFIILILENMHSHIEAADWFHWRSQTLLILIDDFRGSGLVPFDTAPWIETAYYIEQTDLTGGQRRDLTGLGVDPADFAVSADGKVINGRAGGALCFWDTATGKCVPSLERAPTRPPSNGRKELQQQNGHPVMHDLSTGQRYNAIWPAGDKYAFEGILWDTDAALVSDRASNGRFSIVDLRTGAVRKSFQSGYGQGVYQAIVCADQRRVIITEVLSTFSSGVPHPVELWDLATASRIETIGNPVIQSNTSVPPVTDPAGRLLVVVSPPANGGPLEASIWDTADGHCIAMADVSKFANIYQIALSGDGRRLAVFGAAANLATALVYDVPALAASPSTEPSSAR